MLSQYAPFFIESEQERGSNIYGEERTSNKRFGRSHRFYQK